MRLLQFLFIVSLTLLTVFIANDGRSHPQTDESNVDNPMTWPESNGDIVTYYWKSQADYYNDDEESMSDHSSASSYCSATRSLRQPANESSKRYENAWATAEVSAKKENDHIPDGEYCLYTKIIFQDKTGIFQGDDTLVIGDNSTINEGWEYYDIMNNMTDGTDFTGIEISFSDTAVYSMNVKGKNRLAAIAKSWIENVQHTAVYEIHDMAYSKVWL